MGHQTDNSQCVGNYRKIAFSGRFHELVRIKAGQGVPIARQLAMHEVPTLARQLSKSIGTIAGAEVIARVLRHNPAIVQVVDRDTDGALSFLAYLPLNVRGLDALTNGRLDRRDPDLSCLCKAGERPLALYIWCLYAPRNMIAALTAIAAHFESIAPDGVPLFTSAATPHARRVFARLGFQNADTAFPRVDKDILLVMPAHLSETPMVRREGVTTRLGRGLEDVMKVWAIRAATYMSEQHCPYDEEFDGNDHCAAHIIGEIGGEPAGCIRILFFGDFVKFERLAVRSEFRASSLAFRLVRAAIDYAREKGFAQVYGHARADLVSFWSRFGFTPLPDRPVFSFSGVPYVEMAGPIGKSNNSLKVGDNPMKIVRPEGAWEMPGPLERPYVDHHMLA